MYLEPALDGYIPGRASFGRRFWEKENWAGAFRSFGDGSSFGNRKSVRTAQHRGKDFGTGKRKRGR